MADRNSLIFDDLAVEDDFRWLLSQRLAEDDAYDLYGREVNLIPMDEDLLTKVELPAVSFYIYQNNVQNEDDEQLQTYTTFTAEINIYTSGSGKVAKNRQLCNMIIAILQSNGQLPQYYCRGLHLEENTEMNTLLNDAYRRVIRMTGLCDNNQKLIK